MSKKKDLQVAASIDVGSNYLRMAIGEISADGNYFILEDIVKSTNIGRDTFSTGRISIQTIHETCADLKKFVKLIKDYRVKNYKAVSTSGIREAENREYIMEQVRLKTGIEIEIINNAQERFFLYKALRKQLSHSILSDALPLLIINIASGGVEISIYESENLLLTEYIKLGSLRLHETLSGLESKSLNFPGVMEEFIESKIYLIESSIKNMNIQNFIGLGGELNTIVKLFGNNIDKNDGILFIHKKDMVSLYEKMTTMGSDRIINEYKITKKECEILLPSVILFHCFLKLTKAKGILAPMVSLRHGILYNIADKLFDTPGNINSISDIISSAWYIAEKYNVDKNHAKFVEEISLSIFDQSAKYHGLNNDERLYLQVAAILHDTGNYVNLSEHHIHSYSIIRVRKITGFSNREILLIAGIAKYHAYDIPVYSDENYRILTDREKIVVSKLSAILKLAESLDVSHRQKIKKLQIEPSGDALLFHIYSNTDTLLEEWDFIHNTPFFEEVMGIIPLIKHKG
ncbi:exopolyphosphatase [Oxobacter pfennigii]|uniref:Exopolyphosphatase n=1 Tax=Oxobacter pfennigii TaxID=36849 RepID=A0A0P9ABD2_9CLOT|nr:HD domain-containing protein [Oxobacter pfennigii]KPU42364.1 exopolyphosphatase [Oxobacter pfennigii]